MRAASDHRSNATRRHALAKSTVNGPDPAMRRVGVGLAELVCTTTVDFSANGAVLTTLDALTVLVLEAPLSSEPGVDVDGPVIAPELRSEMASPPASTPALVTGVV